MIRATALACAFACLPGGIALAQEALPGLSPTHRDGARTENPRALPNLVERAGPGPVEPDGTLSWKALGAIEIIRRDNADGRYGRFVAHFAEPVVRADVMALAGRTVRVRGYALPRGGVEGLQRVLVSGLPAADDDGCTAGGAETFVDAILRDAPRIDVDRLVTVEGRLALFDPARWSGIVYRLEEARLISEGPGK